jgi:hypothetical protein
VIAHSFYQTWTIVVSTVNVDDVPRTVIKPFSVDIVCIFLIVVVCKTVVGLHNRNICLLLTGAYDICPLMEQLGFEGLVLVMVVVACESRCLGVCTF